MVVALEVVPICFLGIVGRVGENQIDCAGFELLEPNQGVTAIEFSMGMLVMKLRQTGSLDRVNGPNLLPDSRQFKLQDRRILFSWRHKMIISEG